MIAPTARVHPDAVIGPGTRVGEFCVIESDSRTSIVALVLWVIGFFAGGAEAAGRRRWYGR